MVELLHAFVIPPILNYPPRFPLESAPEKEGETTAYFSTKGMFRLEEIKTCGKLIKTNVYEAPLCSDATCLGQNQLCTSKSEKGCPCWETLPEDINAAPLGPNVEKTQKLLQIDWNDDQGV